MKFSVALHQKQAIGELLLEDIYIFPIISYRKWDRRIADFFFFRLYGNEGLVYYKFALKKLGIEYNWLNILF